MTSINNNTRKKIPWWVWVGAAGLIVACCVILVVILVLTSGVLKDDITSVFQEDPAQVIVQSEQSETVVEGMEQTSEPEAGSSPSEAEESEPAAENSQVQGVFSGDPLLVITDKGIWMANETTLETVRLSSYPLDAPNDLSEGMASDKRAFAYISGLDDDTAVPRLIILDLEQEKILAEIELSGAQSQLSAGSQICDSAFEARRAIGDLNSLAWSPDGQQLAFVSARDGESADLYLFNRRDNSVTRLSDDPSHVSDLHWSPNGQFIEYISATCFGTGAGVQMAGIWAYDVWANQVNRLEGNMASAGESFLGWEDDDTFLIRSWGMTCSAYGLRKLNAVTGEQENIFYGCFTDAAYDPQEKQGLVSVTESYNGEECFCGESVQAGLYLFSEDIPFKKFIQLENEVFNIGFNSEANIFTIYGGASGLQAIFDKNLMEVQIPSEVEGLRPYPSPNGDYWAWISYYNAQPGMWVTGNNISPVVINPIYIPDDLPRPVWNTAGDTLYFVEINYVLAASAPDFSGVSQFNFPGEQILGLAK